MPALAPLRTPSRHPQNRTRLTTAQPARALFGGGGSPRAPSPSLSASPAAENRGALRLFLDSASVVQVKKQWLYLLWDQFAKTGLLHGFTTNPSILLRDGVPACSPKVLGVLAAQAWTLGAKELHLQAWGGSAAALYSAGLDLAAIDPRVVVKVPATAAGVEAASLLKGAGAAVTLTGLFAAHQAVSAVGVGADYAAPYLSRIASSGPGRDGRLEVGAMQAVVENLDARTRILVASVKSLEDLVVLATQGLTTFTLSPDLMRELLNAEAATAAAAEEFEAAARQLGAA